MIINPKQVMLGNGSGLLNCCNVLDIIQNESMTVNSSSISTTYRNYIIFNKEKYPYVNLNVVNTIPDGVTHAYRFIEIYHKDDQIKMLIYGTKAQDSPDKIFMGIIQTCSTNDEIPDNDMTGYKKYCEIIIRLQNISDNDHHLYFNGLTSGNHNAGSVTYAFRFSESTIVSISAPAAGYVKSYKGPTLYCTDTIDMNAALSQVNKLTNKFISR